MLGEQLLSDLSGLGQGELEGVLRSTRVQVFPAGRIVFRTGNPGDTVYLLRFRKVTVMIDVGGKLRRLATLGPGSTFGEMALIDGDNRSATIVIDEDAECLVISRTDLGAWTASSPGSKSRSTRT